MPMYQYSCSSCTAEFEELLTLPEEVKKYRNNHPCPSCGKTAKRVKVSSFSFNFKGGVRGTSGVNGQSGSHDLDYPNLDKAVGRSADAKHAQYARRLEARNRIRKETGSMAISQSEDVCLPADPRAIRDREKALKLFDKAKKNG
jgi:putative FmdB family regulatory protein